MAAALILFVVALWLGKGWQQKTTVLKFDLRGAVQLVNQQRSTDSLLILQIPHTEWAYRYYSSDLGRDPFAESDKRLARWAGGPWTNGGSSDADARRDVATLMEQMTAGAPEIWVIFSEATMWDARQLMDEWLDRTMQLVQKNDFYGVQVRHYSRK
jgi:mannosyltransferase